MSDFMPTAGKSCLKTKEISRRATPLDNQDIVRRVEQAGQKRARRWPAIRSSERDRVSPPALKLRRTPSFAQNSWTEFRAKDGGGGGNWTRVPSQPTSRDYMLIPEDFFCYAILSGLKSHCLVRMKRSRLTTRGLRRQPCLLLRPSTVAGVQWRTSWP